MDFYNFSTAFLSVIIFLLFLAFIGHLYNKIFRSWKGFLWFSLVFVLSAIIMNLSSLVFCLTKEEYFFFLMPAIIYTIILTTIIMFLYDVEHYVVVIKSKKDSLEEPIYYNSKLLFRFSNWYKANLQVPLEFKLEGISSLDSFFSSLKLTIHFSNDTMQYFYVKCVEYSRDRVYFGYIKKRKPIELDGQRFFLEMHENLFGIISSNSGFYISLKENFPIDGKSLEEVISKSVFGLLLTFDKKFHFKPKIDSIVLDGVTTIGMKISHEIDIKDMQES